MAKKIKYGSKNKTGSSWPKKVIKKKLLAKKFHEPLLLMIPTLIMAPIKALINKNCKTKINLMLKVFLVLTPLLINQ